MEIVDGFPPNIDAIDKAFKVKNKRGVIYAYDGAIYAPYGQQVSFALRAHEMVHLDRQRRHPGGADGWWNEYIESAEFRLLEELPAHYAEYRYIVNGGASRHERRAALVRIAKRLSGPLYGGLISLGAAKAALEMGPEGAREAARHIGTG